MLQNWGRFHLCLFSSVFPEPVLSLHSMSDPVLTWYLSFSLWIRMGVIRRLVSYFWYWEGLESVFYIQTPGSSHPLPPNSSCLLLIPGVLLFCLTNGNSTGFWIHGLRLQCSLPRPFANHLETGWEPNHPRVGFANLDNHPLEAVSCQPRLFRYVLQFQSTSHPLKGSKH